MQHGKRAAIGREIHQRPRPPAERPRRTVSAALQAQPRLARCARRAEGDAKRARQILGLLQIGRFLLRQALEQRLIRLRLANGRFIEEHQPLQIDLLDTDLGCNLHKGRQFLDGLFQAGEPNRDLRFGVSLPLLQFAKRAHVADDAAEIIPATDRLETLAV